MSFANEYAIEIRKLTEENGGGFLAFVPDLPGCMSDGDTPDEARINCLDAIGCWLEARRKRVTAKEAFERCRKRFPKTLAYLAEN